MNLINKLVMSFARMGKAQTEWTNSFLNECGYGFLSRWNYLWRGTT